MHGSGDVPPDLVDPESVQLLSALTVEYVTNLVDAAIDANEMFRDNNGNKSSGSSSGPPPPPFPRSRMPSKPPPFGRRQYKRKRQKGSDEYWDEPLAEPKIRNSKKQRQETVSSSSATKEEEEINPDEWVGVAGVDMFEDSRTRAAYVGRDRAVSTQSFIFPICHDAYAYGRVSEVLSANRNIEPVLIDSVVMDMVQTEGKYKHAPIPKPAKNKKQAQKQHDTSDPEDEDEDDDDNNTQDESDEEGGPTWPGVDALLPVPDHLTTQGNTTNDAE